MCVSALDLSVTDMPLSFLHVRQQSFNKQKRINNSVKKVSACCRIFDKRVSIIG